MDIAVTGGLGFIGTAVVKHLADAGHRIVAFDSSFRTKLEDEHRLDVEREMFKRPNICGCDMAEGIFDFFKDEPPAWTKKEGYTHFPEKFDAVVHLGACSDTMCQDRIFMSAKNTDYSKQLWDACVKRRVRLIYASSAATYGDGSQGFNDDCEKLSELKPLNIYGESKHLMDLYAVEQAKAGKAPPQWAGLKFFNVYGPYEHHKGRMASMVFRTMQQIEETGSVKLFKDGEQKRDWVWVGDVCSVIEHMLEHPCFSIYNVGSGQARSFNDVAKIAFWSLGKKLNIEYIDMPEQLAKQYQSYSLANIEKLQMNYEKPLTPLEDGIRLIAAEWYKKKKSELDENVKLAVKHINDYSGDYEGS